MKHTFDPDAYFASSFGIIAGDEFKVETIRLRVQGMHRQYVRALPLHHTQREVETGEWQSVFEYRMKPTFDLKQELLSAAMPWKYSLPGRCATRCSPK